MAGASYHRGPKGGGKGFAANFRKRVLLEFRKAGPVLESEVKRLQSTPGTGRVYISRRIKSASGKAAAGKQRRVLIGKRGAEDLAREVHALKRNRGLHVASAPGFPPAVDTGELRGSVGWDVREADAGPVLLGGVRTGAPNASRLHVVAMSLETGASGAGRSKTVRIAPRPSFVPAMRTVIVMIRKGLAGGTSK